MKKKIKNKNKIKSMKLLLNQKHSKNCNQKKKINNFYKKFLIITKLINIMLKCIIMKKN